MFLPSFPVVLEHLLALRLFTSEIPGAHHANLTDFLELSTFAAHNLRRPGQFQRLPDCSSIAGDQVEPFGPQFLADCNPAAHLM